MRTCQDTVIPQEPGPAVWHSAPFPTTLIHAARAALPQKLHEASDAFRREQQLYCEGQQQLEASIAQVGRQERASEEARGGGVGWGGRGEGASVLCEGQQQLEASIARVCEGE